MADAAAMRLVFRSRVGEPLNACRRERGVASKLRQSSREPQTSSIR